MKNINETENKRIKEFNNKKSFFFFFIYGLYLLFVFLIWKDISYTWRGIDQIIDQGNYETVLQFIYLLFPQIYKTILDISLLIPLGAWLSNSTALFVSKHEYSTNEIYWNVYIKEVLKNFFIIALITVILFAICTYNPIFIIVVLFLNKVFLDVLLFNLECGIPVSYTE